MGLFFKLNQTYISWYMKRQQKKQANKKLTEEQQKRKEIAEGFRRLYHFVKWLNTKGLPNRKVRKMFWRNVREGQPVLEKTLKHLIERYEVKQDIRIDSAKMDYIVKGAELGKPREPKKG